MNIKPRRIVCCGSLNLLNACRKVVNSLGNGSLDRTLNIVHLHTNLDTIAS